MATPAFQIDHSFEERSRQDFASSMRTYVLNDLADHMKTVYERRVEPKFEHQQKRAPADGPEVHKAMKPESIFKFYSAIRCNTQELVWRSVIPGVRREAARLADKAAQLSKPNGKAKAALDIDPDFSVPRYISEIDIHLLPGNYHEEHMPGDVSQGLIYDQGFDVFAMNMLGERGEDITDSVSTFIAEKYPRFQPEKILDMGCTIGQSTLPWTYRYPDAEVHGIDVAPPSVRFAHARAQSYGAQAHFHTMDAEHTTFDDETFDLVYSCMLLHEMPPANVRALFKEVHRILKPGGLMLHYELPPNSATGAYDSFYLDWDSYYNKEPFYKALRDTDMPQLMADSGFSRDHLIQHLVPSLAVHGRDALLAAVQGEGQGVDERIGKLVDGVRWYTFGAWK